MLSYRVTEIREEEEEKQETKKGGYKNKNGFNPNQIVCDDEQTSTHHTTPVRLTAVMAAGRVPHYLQQ